MNTSTNPDTVTALAVSFSSILRGWLTADEIAECIAANAAETRQGVCHSHDYCDANEAMDEAFVTVLGFSPETSDEAMNDLWASAWAEAIADEFPTAVTR